MSGDICQPGKYLFNVRSLKRLSTSVHIQLGKSGHVLCCVVLGSVRDDVSAPTKDVVIN